MTRMSDKQFQTACLLIYDWGESGQAVQFDFEEGILTSKLIVIFPDDNTMEYEMDLDGELLMREEDGR